MKIKHLLFILLLTLSILLAACSTDAPTAETQPSTEAVNSATEPAATDPASTVFTPEELSKYNGKGGNPAYVAYEGKVYDVTNISAWKNGIHQGQFEAGKDYTDILNNDAPHSSKNLTDKAPIVGTYETSSESGAIPEELENGSRIAPEAAKARLDSDEAIVLLDVRTEEEYNEGHIEGATLLPLSTIKANVSSVVPNQDATLFVYCRSGVRSAEAVKTLMKLGYTRVYNLGGIIDWPYE